MNLPQNKLNTSEFRRVVHSKLNTTVINPENQFSNPTYSNWSGFLLPKKSEAISEEEIRSYLLDGIKAMAGRNLNRTPMSMPLSFILSKC
jgi:hypothetical protein